jgi:hypothetical protein
VVTDVFGVHLDGLDGALAATSALELSAARRLPSGASVPMAAVLSAGTPLRIHRQGPIPLDGAGLAWPDVAGPTAVLEAPSTGRIPVPFLWERFLSDADDLSGRMPPDRADRALAIAVRAVLEEGVEASGGADRSESIPVAIPIPNELDEGRQQRLLDACRAEGLAPALLWRPVAAALAWLELHTAELARPVEHETSIGSLLCVHAGLDGAEATWLELIQSPSDVVWVRPARTRPDRERRTHAPSLGRELVERAIERCLPGSGPEQAADRWRALWASPLLLAASPSDEVELGLEGFGFEASLAQSFVRALLPADAARSPFSPEPPSTTSGNNPQIPRNRAEFLALKDRQDRGLGRSGASWAARTAGDSSPLALHPLLDWASRLRLTAPDGAPHLGAVVTGAYAALPAGSSTLGERLVEAIAGRRLPRTECEGSAALPRGALARAAATFLARRNAERATYLDTLPQMEVLLEERARPIWKSLLKDDEQYVDGGRLWRRDPDLGGLSVKANDQRFTIELWVEGEDTTRDAEFELPEPPPEPVAVALRAEIEPAGGRARVELIPDQPGALGRRRIQLDWDRARPREWTREERLANYPLKCPRIQPKRAFEGAWARIEDAIHSSRRFALWKYLRTALNHAHQGRQSEGSRGNEEGISMWRPVGVDGRLHAKHHRHQAELEEVIASIAANERQKIERGEHPDLDALVCLGYACAAGNDVDALIAYVLRRPHLRSDHAYFLAGTLRDADQIADFLFRIRDRLEGDTTGLNEILKSAGYLLQWREEALDALASEHALAIVRRCQGLIARVVEPWQHGSLKNSRKLMHLERNALVMIAFMLRRRIRDDGFLPPRGEDAASIKKLLQLARFKLSDKCQPEERISAIGGMVDMRTLLQQVIKYIDEEGTGTLVTE